MSELEIQCEKLMKERNFFAKKNATLQAEMDQHTPGKPITQESPNADLRDILTNKKQAARAMETIDANNVMRTQVDNQNARLNPFFIDEQAAVSRSPIGPSPG